MYSTVELNLYAIHRKCTLGMTKFKNILHIPDIKSHGGDVPALRPDQTIAPKPPST